MKVTGPFPVAGTWLLLPLVLLLTGAASAGEIYTWKDENGKVHFGDRKPAAAASTRVQQQRINSIESVEVRQSSQDVGRQVVMYVTDWCGHCKRAREYFREFDIPFREYDIEKEATARRKYDSLGGKGVPLILVGDQRMSGFSPERFNQLYQQ